MNHSLVHLPTIIIAAPLALPPVAYAQRAPQSIAHEALDLIEQAFGPDERPALEERVPWLDALPTISDTLDNESVRALLDTHRAWMLASTVFEDDRAAVGVSDRAHALAQATIAHTLLRFVSEGGPALERALDGGALDDESADRAAIALEGALVLGGARGCATLSSLLEDERPRAAAGAARLALEFSEPVSDAIALRAIVRGHAQRVLGQNEDANRSYLRGRELASGSGLADRLLAHEATLGLVLLIPDDELADPRVDGALRGLLPALTGGGVDGSDQGVSMSASGLSLDERMALLTSEVSFRIASRRGDRSRDRMVMLASLYERHAYETARARAWRSRVHSGARAMAERLLARGVRPDDLPPLAQVSLIEGTRSNEQRRMYAERVYADQQSSLPVRVDAALGMLGRSAPSAHLERWDWALEAAPSDDRARAVIAAMFALSADRSDDGALIPIRATRRAIDGRYPSAMDALPTLVPAALERALVLMRRSESDALRNELLDEAIALYNGASTPVRRSSVRTMVMIAQAAARLLPGVDRDELSAHAQAWSGDAGIANAPAPALADCLLAAGDPRGALRVLDAAGRQDDHVDGADRARVRVQALIELERDDEALETLVASWDLVRASGSRLAGDRRLSRRAGIDRMMQTFLADEAGIHTDLNEEARVLRLGVRASRVLGLPDDGTLLREAACALIACGRADQALELLPDESNDPAMRMLTGEAMLALGDEQHAFAAFRALAGSLSATPEDRARREHWHAWTRMLEILALQNEDGARTQSIEDTIRRLRALPSWGLWMDCVDRIERLSRTLPLERGIPE